MAKKIVINNAIDRRKRIGSIFHANNGSTAKKAITLDATRKNGNNILIHSSMFLSSQLSVASLQ